MPAEKESAVVDLRKQVRQLAQNEAAFSKQQKALEAQVGAALALLAAYGKPCQRTASLL